MKTTEKCVNKIARLDSIIEKHSAYLSMSKKDLALWTIWFARGQRLKQKIIESYAKETAVKFRMDTSPLTPQIVDGEKKVREQTERLYDNWKNKQNNPRLAG